MVCFEEDAVSSDADDTPSIFADEDTNFGGSIGSGNALNEQDTQDVSAMLRVAFLSLPKGSPGKKNYGESFQVNRQI